MTHQLSEIEVGARLARKIWEWLGAMQQVRLVPWVNDPKSDAFDAIAAAKIEGTHETLDALEAFIHETVKEIQKELGE